MTGGGTDLPFNLVKIVESFGPSGLQLDRVHFEVFTVVYSLSERLRVSRIGRNTLRNMDSYNPCRLKYSQENGQLQSSVENRISVCRNEMLNGY